MSNQVLDGCVISTISENWQTYHWSLLKVVLRHLMILILSYHLLWPVHLTIKELHAHWHHPNNINYMNRKFYTVTDHASFPFASPPITLISPFLNSNKIFSKATKTKLQQLFWMKHFVTCTSLLPMYCSYMYKQPDYTHHAYWKYTDPPGVMDTNYNVDWLLYKGSTLNNIDIKYNNI